MNSSWLNAAATAALIAGTFCASLLANGTSPIVWSDTLNDEYSVRQCVTNDTCALTGTGTSVRGFSHAVSWFQLRSLLGSLGLGLDGSHVVIQVLNALAAGLVFAIGRRLGGWLTGVLAACLFVDGYASLRIETAALYNSPPLPFLGAVFLLACMAIVERPGILSVTLAALVGAIMANVHLACILTGLSVVSAALLAPRRRFVIATIGVLVFALATYLVAPPLWLHNATNFLQPPPAVGNAPAKPRLEGWALSFISLLAVGAWIGSLRSRSAAWARCRHQMKGPLAVSLPFIVAFLTAAFVGLDATAKYLGHIVAAAAVGAALPVAVVMRQLLRNRLGTDDSARKIAVRMARAAPFAMAAILPFRVEPPRDNPPTIRDLREVQRALRDQHGWTNQQMIANLQSSAGMPALMGLRELAIADPSPESVQSDPTTSALLVSLNSADLPTPLPPNWAVIRQSTQSALVLIVTRSRIDWSRFEVCLRLSDGSTQWCKESGLRFEKDAFDLEARNMPSGAARWSGTLTLRLPLRAAIPSHTEAIFMPRMGLLCGGRVGGMANGTVRIGADRRQAVVVGTDAPGLPETIELDWELGTPECSDYTYQGWPPFVVVGDVATVQLIGDILRKRETSNGS